MHGYPKHIATKQDFVNLLAVTEHRERALEDLKKIYELNDDYATRATTVIDPEDPSKGYNTETIENTMPRWKQKGFASRQEVADTILENGGSV